MSKLIEVTDFIFEKIDNSTNDKKLIIDEIQLKQKRMRDRKKVRLLKRRQLDAKIAEMEIRQRTMERSNEKI